MNGKKTLVAVVAAILCVGTGAFAYQIGWDSISGTSQLTLNGAGAQLGVGSLVMLGNFGTMADSDVAALGANATAVAAAFQTYDTGAIDSDGLYNVSSTVAGAATFSLEGGYLVAFNGATAAASTQVGVFKGATSSPSEGDAWQFPASDGADPVLWTLGASGVIIGSLGTFDSPAFAGTVTAYELAGVPEPSTYMLVGTGLLGLLALRRRRS